MKPAIEVTGLSKSYLINHKNKASYSTLKDDFGRLLKHPFKKDANYDKQEVFWALDDVNFSVKKGEIFGIVGRNGSGKSTTLKILSRIVDPTKGSITMRGRTASLLEVGTGFNPELTGRENVFFNGSMLGMSKREINSKFNDIVRFSEVEKFLDTPVKYYSSGMYVRLAFSVAAHLEPDILILDEVLAVGDAAFQKKSLNKILETMNDGRTVLFVSHSMAAVQQLCSRGMLLKNGRLEYCGPIGEVAERYEDLVRQTTEPEVTLATTWKNDGSISNEHFIPISLRVEEEDGTAVMGPVQNNKDRYVVIEAEIVSSKDLDLLTVGYAIYNQHHTPMYITFPTDKAKSEWPKYKKGKITMRGKIPKHLLNAGAHKIGIVGGIYNKYWFLNPDEQVPSIEYVVEGGLSSSPFFTSPRSGYMAPDIDWEVRA